MTLAILIVLLIALIASGLPLAFALGLFSVVALHWHFGLPLETVPNFLVDNLNSTVLLALPFFTLGAVWMSEGGLAQRIMDVADVYLGQLPGGVGVATVGGSTVFAGITGSSAADSMAIGAVAIPRMTALGYPKDLAAGIVTCAGTLGILIPPSGGMIIYGYVTGTSVGQLFMAGVIPGLTLAVVLMAVVVLRARRRGLHRGASVPWRAKLRLTASAAPALGMPLIILGGIYLGIFTATESAVVAAVYGLFLTVVVYRSLRLRDVPRVAAQALRPIGMLMFLIANALLFAQVVTLSGIPNRLAVFLTGLNINAKVLIALTMLVLLLLGTILEGATLILVTMPVLFPMLTSLGLDPIHLGVMLIVTIEIALVIPPLGLNLYAVGSVAKMPIESVARGALPFVVAMILFLGVVSVFPQMSTWLPSQLIDAPKPVTNFP